MTQEQRRIRQFARILTSLVDKSLEAKQWEYSHNPAMDRFLRHEPFALLLGVIADQQVQADRAWALPFVLSARLGHLDPHRMARMSEKRLAKIIGQKPALHRFTHTMARWFIRAAQRVCKEYGGRAELIWLTTDSAAVIYERLTAFSGIKQKKASMFTKILVRDQFVQVTDLHRIDLPNDIHVKRVLVRAGIARNDTVADIVEAGRKLYPKYPGLLDDAIWLIGRRYCHARNPNHTDCPLYGICPSVVNDHAYAPGQ